jgi:predicted transcriptional regulator
MTLLLELPTELEERLNQEAERTGLPTEDIALQLLDQHLPAAERRRKAMALLQSWLNEEDKAEQQETGEYLQRVLDEDRLSDRALFPKELQGVTW